MIRTSQMTDAAFLALIATRPVSGGKGDKTAQAGEKSSLSFANTLQAAFRQQFGTNTAILNFLNGKMTDMANNPTGFSPAAIASANSNAIDQAAVDTQNATRAANETAAAHGGNGLPSGVQAQIAGQIQAAGVAEKDQSLNQIQLANAEQQQKNYWAAVSGLSNVAEQENPNGYAGGANSGMGVIAGLSEADTQRRNSGFGHSFASGFGSALGKGLGGFATGGLSTISGFGGSNSGGNGG
jgi:hypothetical protein